MTDQVRELNADLLVRFLKGGSDYLGKHKEAVNALNVFPVPDGDTGINMHLTVNSAVKNILGKNYKNVADLGADFAMGALMGARGNSGVILSQIFRGFSQSLAGKERIDAVDFAEALQKGVDLSYKSVMKPVEGTILTVYRYFAKEARKRAKHGGDIIALLEQALLAGEKALANTPNLLPVLKEAGVVDAGGKGLLVILEGGMRALKGEEIAALEDVPAAVVGAQADQQAAGDLEFVFCTQLLIKGRKLPIDQIRDHLAQDPPGDSLLVVGTEEVVKIHFHNNQPWKVLQYCAQFGTLHDISIENMADQAEHKTTAASMQEIALEQGPIKSEPAVAAPEPPAARPEPCATAVVAVCAGDGLAEIFASMGALVITGGQTMNPSAEDLLKAIKDSNGEEVVLLPNNSNIILTAQQAQKLTDKPVYVVPSKYVTQGIAAMLPYDKNADGASNAAAMQEAIEAGVNCELTYAVRESKVNGFEIQPNDILALENGKIVAVGKELEPTLFELLDGVVAASDDYSMISFFYGNDMSEQQAAALAEQLEERYPDYDLEYHYGGQPLYYMLLSVE